MTSNETGGSSPVLVGIVPNQHPEVLQTAAVLAARLHESLVCAYVDEASYLVEWDPDRSAHRLSLHPEANGDDIRAAAAELRAAVESAVAEVPAETGRPEWNLRTLSGDPSRALARLAAETDASMIVVGTPERGFSHRLAEVLSGSVAAWLTHHQSKPVLVVPYRMPARGDRR